MRKCPPESRFWSKVDKSPGQGPKGDCWEWQGAKTDRGYGRIKDGKRMTLAHRLSFVMAYGALPHVPGHHGACVLHRCDNPACVRPEHRVRI